MPNLINASDILPVETGTLYSRAENLIMHSCTQQSWKRHRSAWALFDKFSNELQLEIVWPVNISIVRAFATWAVTSRNLKVDTVKTYISSLNVAHYLKGLSPPEYFKDKCLKMILKGSENVTALQSKSLKQRLSMNLSLLKILAHRIFASSWEKTTKLCIWAACAVAFYTSCRLGELLAPRRLGFDKATTLKWADVAFLENGEILITLPYTKTTGFKGDCLTLYPLVNDAKCPVKAVKRLKSSLTRNGLYNESFPVFVMSTGVFLTTFTLNKVMGDLLSDFVDDETALTAHSFRCAIPSAISASNISNRETIVKEWGRWETTCYTRYTRREEERKRKLFYDVVKLL